MRNIINAHVETRAPYTFKRSSLSQPLDCRFKLHTYQLKKKMWMQAWHHSFLILGHSSSCPFSAIGPWRFRFLFLSLKSPVLTVYQGYSLFIISHTYWAEISRWPLHSPMVFFTTPPVPRASGCVYPILLNIVFLNCVDGHYFSSGWSLCYQ